MGAVAVGSTPIALAGAQGHGLFLGPHVDTEEARDLRSLLAGAHRAFARQCLALGQGFRKRPAPGKATGTAVRVRKHLLHHVDSRILVDVQLLVGQDQRRSEDECEATNGPDRREK